MDAIEALHQREAKLVADLSDVRKRLHQAKQSVNQYRAASLVVQIDKLIAELEQLPSTVGYVKTWDGSQ